MRPNHRAKPRRPLHYLAWIERGDGVPPLKCTFADVSEDGARLRVEDAQAIPQTFGLRLLSDGAPKRLCHVVWRTETEIGLRFDQPATARNSLNRA